MAAGRMLLRLRLLPFHWHGAGTASVPVAAEFLAIRTAAEDEIADWDEKQTIPYDLRQILPGPVSVCIHSSSFDENWNLGCVELILQEMQGHNQ